MQYVSREQWGAKPWATAPYVARWSQRTEVLVHYHGNPPRVSRGPQVARDVDAIHHDNGWAGVGYNWLVDLDGVVYEGRGWGLVGAHCPDHNTSGIGIYVAIGGAQKPTDAALRAVRDLYDQACRLAGRQLRKSWHGENYATACPGLPLIGWVRGGMVRPGAGPALAVPAATKTPVTLRRLLKRGAKGKDVETVQRIVGTTPDGDFGGLTESAVIRWQGRRGLDPDGIVGPATAKAMGLGWAGAVNA